MSRSKQNAYLDPAPLLKWVDSHPEVMRGYGSVKEGEISSVMGRLCEIRKQGRVTPGAADKICCLVQVHPAEIFGDAYWMVAL